jgi:thiol-disulfide isomerase/thioredoxin
MRKTIVIRIISITMLIWLFSCKGHEQNKPASNTKNVQEFNNIILKDLNDQLIDPEKYKGKAIFLNIWATWCKPCMEEMPTIAAAQDSLHDSGMIFLLASNESIDQIKEFRDNHFYKFNYVRIENFEDLNIEALPATFVFSKSGDLVFSELGYRKWNQRNSIDTLLKISNIYD